MTNTETMLTNAEIVQEWEGADSVPSFARAIEQAVLQSPEMQALWKSIEIKNEALMSAQQQISGMRPDGSSDPQSPQWRADAALWDYYQDAINATKERPI